MCDWLYPWEQFAAKFESYAAMSLSGNAFENVFCQIDFVSALICWMKSLYTSQDVGQFIIIQTTCLTDQPAASKGIWALCI